MAIFHTNFLFFWFSFLLFFSFAVCSRYEQEELQWLDDKDDEIIMVQNRHSSLRSCDFGTGKWVYDQSYPLYDATCPYLSTAVTCRKNGRPDSDYEKWKWKPHGCEIPRYAMYKVKTNFALNELGPPTIYHNPPYQTCHKGILGRVKPLEHWRMLNKHGPTWFDALDFLGRMRRKRIMLVGDSIMRNQWESLVCLVQSVIPTARKTVTYTGPTMAFQALDYETSIEFCWAPFLVELKKGPGNKRILHLDLIEENARYWREVDVLVFDSAHWWTHSEKWSSWDFLMEGNNAYKNMNPMVAYEKGLMTWANWIDLNIDPRRTRVFFRSMSPSHNRENGLKCYNQREPIGYLSHPHAPEQLLVLQEVLKRTRFPVYLQDITTMSALRQDGHPSIYARALGEKAKREMRGYSSDCSHWCLPGVPDTWNEMLNAML